MGSVRLALFPTPRRRLQLVTALAGGVFVWCVVETPSLAFTQLPPTFPSSFRDRRGFFHVLRWLEQLDQPDALAAFLHAMAAFHAQPLTVGSPPRVFQSAAALLAHVQLIAAWETYLLLSKMVLQWGLLVFLSRAKAVSTRTAIACVCLSILSLICTKMAQSSLLELLSPSSSSSLSVSPMKQQGRAAFLAAFLGLIFLVRLVAGAIVNGVLAYAYQSFFGCWPPARWKDVPRFFGSKNFAFSTLFYGVTSVSVMAVSARSLRSLSEAAGHIESVALVAALSHFLVHEFGLKAAVTPAVTPTEKDKRA